MHIILRGEHDITELNTELLGALQMLMDKYHIKHFRDIDLTVTLMDAEGYDVELMDTKSGVVYRFFELSSEGLRFSPAKRPGAHLRLVVDNTKPLDSS